MATLEELKADFEELTADSLPDLEELKAEFKSLTSTFSGLGNKLGGLKDVTKEMSKSKFKKATTKLKGVFKAMQGGIQTAAIQILFEVLKPLLGLLKPFSIALEILGSLFEAMVGSALGPMFEAMQPVFDMLVGMLPVFVSLGETLGALIATAMEPLVEIIIAMSPLIELLVGVLVDLIGVALQPVIMILEFFAEHIDSLMPIFTALIGLIIPLVELAMVPLMIILEVLFAILEPFMPLLAEFGTIIEMLEPVISVLAIILKDVVLGAIKGIAYGFAALIDVLTGGIAGATKAVDKFFGAMGKSTSTTTSSTSKKTIPHNIPQMQEGGITLSEGLYHLHDREIVAPLDPFTKEQGVQKVLLGNILSELMNQSSIQRKALLENEFNHIFERT